MIALVLLAPRISVKVNKNDPAELYEQVAAEIRRAIADGEAKPGAAYPRPRTPPPSSA
jgi:DNA-binding transcriptional regulator YhcF (GntR family)